MAQLPVPIMSLITITGYFKNYNYEKKLDVIDYDYKMCTDIT